MIPQVLILDDDPEVLRAMAEGLAREGYQVTCASAADSAYALLGSQRFDAVVLDLAIPQIAGDTLALAITRRWPRLVGRIILMSGEPSRIERLRLHGSTFPCLSKPFALGDLSALIESMLHRFSERRRDGTTNGLQ